MLNFALIGAGRIGKMHAEIINANPETNLKFVYDVNNDSAKQVSKENNSELSNGSNKLTSTS